MFKNKKYKVVLVIIIVFVVGVIGYMYINKKVNVKSDNIRKIEKEIVKKDNITTTLEGSGVVEPIDRYEISSLVSGEVIYDGFKKGDMVHKDDLLYKIDSSDLEYSIKKINLNISKQNLEKNELINSKNDLEIYSDVNGKVVELDIKEGDLVNKNQVIAHIIDDSKMIAKVPFAIAKAEIIEEGQKAKVILQEYTMYIDGIVVGKDKSSSTKDGYLYNNVYIEIVNEGALVKDLLASASVYTDKGEMFSGQNGILEYKEDSKILSKSSGTIDKVNIEETQIIKEGDLLLILKSDDLDNDILKSKYNSSSLYIDLENKKNDLELYNIKSPINGTIISKKIKKGDKINNNSNSKIMMVIADMSKMRFTMEIDELDIAKVKLGQKAKVVADALEDKKFEAVVTNIAAEGVASNGVTTYEVELVIDEPVELRSGMNISSEIIISEKKDVNVIPSIYLKNIRNKNYVLIEKDGKYKMQEVEVGLNDGVNIEIISGLNLNDIVIKYSENKIDNNKAKFSKEKNMMPMSGMNRGMSRMGSKRNFKPKGGK